MIDALNKAKLSLPLAAPKKWIVDSRHVGQGKPALKYLSRYLYRGVLSNKAIKSHRNGMVTFEYIDSDTNKIARRQLTGAAFCWHILQHVLPKGFRRVRDYGFVHGNAKKWLGLIQLLLHMIITPVMSR
ncbi:MAG: transposase [Psychrobium sp.]|nr:transposase [Psychrobium sp.]